MRHASKPVRLESIDIQWFLPNKVYQICTNMIHRVLIDRLYETTRCGCYGLGAFPLCAA